MEPQQLSLYLTCPAPRDGGGSSLVVCGCDLVYAGRRVGCEGGGHGFVLREDGGLEQLNAGAPGMPGNRTYAPTRYTRAARAAIADMEEYAFVHGTAAAPPRAMGLRRMHVCDRWCHPGLHAAVYIQSITMAYTLEPGQEGCCVPTIRSFPSGVGAAMRMLAHFRALDSDDD